MEELTTRQEAVLNVLDEEIAKLEKHLKKVQPLINELNKLKQTRRVLLSEKGGASGGGRADVQLTMEMVVNYMREHPEGVTPMELTEHYGVPGQTVRSHLNRGKETRYELRDGKWFLTEQDSDEEEE